MFSSLKPANTHIHIFTTAQPGMRAQASAFAAAAASKPYQSCRIPMEHQHHPNNQRHSSPASAQHLRARVLEDQQQERSSRRCCLRSHYQAVEWQPHERKRSEQIYTEAHDTEAQLIQGRDLSGGGLVQARRSSRSMRVQWRAACRW